MNSLFSLFILATTALAAPEVPPPAAGTYEFKGDFTVSMKLHYEVAYAFVPEGKQKLERLRKEGYECWYKMRDTWLCKQFQKTDGAADLLRDRVEKDLAHKPFTLGERFGEPSLISKGTDVAEYRVIQKAEFEGKAWDSYRLVMGQGHWSIRMGEPTELQFSLVNGQLLKWEQYPVTESKQAYSVYIVEARFAQ